MVIRIRIPHSRRQMQALGELRYGETGLSGPSGAIRRQSRNTSLSIRHALLRARPERTGRTRFMKAGSQPGGYSGFGIAMQHVDTQPRTPRQHRSSATGFAPKMMTSCLMLLDGCQTVALRPEGRQKTSPVSSKVVPRRRSRRLLRDRFPTSGPACNLDCLGNAG